MKPKETKGYSDFASKLKELIKNYGGHERVVEALKESGYSRMTTNNFTQLLFRTSKGKGFLLEKNSTLFSSLLNILGTNKNAFWESSELQPDPEQLVDFGEVKPSLEEMRRMLGRLGEQVTLMRKQIPKERARAIKFPVKITEILWPFLRCYGITDFEYNQKTKESQEKKFYALYKKEFNPALSMKLSLFSSYDSLYSDLKPEDLRFYYLIEKCDSDFQGIVTKNVDRVSSKFYEKFTTTGEFDEVYASKASDYAIEQDNLEFCKRQNYFTYKEKRSKKAIEYFTKNIEKRITSYYKFLGKKSYVFDDFLKMLENNEYRHDAFIWLELYFIWFLLHNMLNAYKGFANRKYGGEDQVKASIYTCFKENLDSLAGTLKFIIKDKEHIQKYLPDKKYMDIFINTSIKIGKLFFITGFRETTDTDEDLILDIEKYENEVIILSNRISNLCEYISIRYNPKSIGLSESMILKEGQQ